jgi:hypothetical protein
MSRPESALTDSAGFRNSLAFRSVFVIVGWLSSLCVCLLFEYSRMLAAINSPAGALGWFADWNPDTTLPFLVLLTLPLIVFSGVRGVRLRAIWMKLLKPAEEAGTTSLTQQPKRYWLITAGLFLVSFICSASIGLREMQIGLPAAQSELTDTVRFARLPPAYHDEFSYLLQARTFLAGRLSWPPMTVRPDLFHQIHVLNEPTTASRYFPLTGAWLAPFVAYDVPWLGQWVAGALSCAFFFRCLLRLLPLRSAIVGGLLIAVSPGLAIFSNLLLAHHVTMLALSVFLWAFLRLMTSNRTLDALIAGVFLAFAMLGRPMTAAGFALPFGVWFVLRLRQRRLHRAITADSAASPGIGQVLAMGGPIIIGFVVLGIMNQSITGQWNRSAYQYYTDTWTPSHRFGFNNAEVGQKAAGPQTLKAYDRWATNLTPRKALENLWYRTIASSQWSLGITALLFAILCALPSCGRMFGGDPRIGLVSLSIISLHVVHIPYWYDGILHWHYVFETAPLLLMMAAVGFRNAEEVLRAIKIKRAMRVWLLALVAACLLPNWVTADSFWGPSRVSQAVSEQAFSRVRFELFNRLVNSSAIQHPCLILVDERNSDPQLSYIINPPDLSGDVLTCRHPASAAEIAELSNAFPERMLYVFDPATFQLTKSDSSVQSRDAPTVTDSPTPTDVPRAPNAKEEPRP